MSDTDAVGIGDTLLDEDVFKSLPMMVSYSHSYLYDGTHSGTENVDSYIDHSSDNGVGYADSNLTWIEQHLKWHFLDLPICQMVPCSLLIAATTSSVVSVGVSNSDRMPRAEEDMVKVESQKLFRPARGML